MNMLKSSPALRRHWQSDKLTRSAIIWPIAALIVVLVLQFTLALHRAINWDEFYHYSQIHLLANGTLTRPLQSLYTRAFEWVIHLPGTGVDHIILIRHFMFLCELVTLAAIAGMAVRFSNLTTALLCALSYISVGYVFQHGTSFRFDPPAAALLMSALWILLRSRLDTKGIIATGLLAGLAAMITIKAVLYAPAFAGIIWLRWNENGRTREYLLRVAATGVAALVAFIAIYALHSIGLSAEADGEARKVITRSAGKMFSIGYQPYWPHALKGAIFAPIVTLLIAIVPFALLRSSRPMAERLALFCLFLPITTLLFYHNTAPYYYAFMLPPVVVACSIAVPALTIRYGAAGVSFLFLFCAGMILALEPENPVKKQRQLLQAADRMFPTPVSYFDSCAMLGNFPKANVFMTPWGMELYMAGGFPSMRETMEKRAVPLVMDNDYMFRKALHTKDNVAQFLPGDLPAIRSTYVNLWGPFWIAGEVIPVGSGNHAFELLVPGPYTVHGGAVVVDGVTARPGDVIELGRGKHIATGPRGAEIRLIWGKNIQIPDDPAPPEPYYMPF